MASVRNFLLKNVTSKVDEVATKQYGQAPLGLTMGETGIYGIFRGGDGALAHHKVGSIVTALLVPWDKVDEMFNREMA